MAGAPGHTAVHPTAGIGARLFAPVVDPIAHRIDAERHRPVFQRDAEFIGRRLAAVTRLVNLFSPEVRRAEHLPATGPALVVGNHSCLYFMPDAWLVALEIIRRRGVEQPAYGLVYDLLCAVPVAGPFLRRLGAIPAGGPQAEEALAQGAVVLDYPGGDREACRPWAERNHVDLGGHDGFVRLALRAGVPVVPVVAHGSHQAVLVVWRGDRLAGALGLGRLRIHVLPVVLGPPFGLTPVLAVPLPSAVTVEFLPALDWRDHGPAAAEDDAVVAACYAQVTDAMQAALDRLAAERPHPVRRGMANLVRRGPRRVAVPPLTPTGT